MLEFNATSAFEDLPVEMKNTIFNYLPQYTLIGKASVHTVSKQWNEMIKESSSLHQKSSKKQLIDSIQTEEDALLFFENDKICDEMDYKWLLRLAFKIPEVRNAIGLRLEKSELFDLCKYDINNANYFLGLGMEYVSPSDKQIITSEHVTLSHQFLDKHNKIDGDDAVPFSENLLCVAKRILNTPEISQEYTKRQRFSIIWGHTQLVEENLEMCSDMLDENIDDDEQTEFCNFLIEHGKSRVVADFLLKRYEETFNLRPEFLIILSSYHLHIARQLFAEDTIINELTSEILLVITLAHFEMAKELITKPDLVMDEDYADTVFRLIYKHFPDSKCFLLDEKYHLKDSFYKAYGPVLALPRMQMMLASNTSTAYDFKVAFAHSLFEHPEIMLQYNKVLMIFLAEFIDELHSVDFKAMQPAIIKVFENDKQNNDLDRILGLKLIAKMPFLLDEEQSNENYFRKLFLAHETHFSMSYINYRATYLEHHPVIARKVMNSSNLAKLFDDYDGSIRRSLGTRDLIKEVVQQLKLEKQTQAPNSFKPQK